MADNNIEEIEDLPSCELGTKEHWEKTFQDELENFRTHGVLGDIWFGEDIMLKIVQYIERSSEIPPEAKIVDLGCGNGVLLLELAREGYTNSTGLDYSINAIKMAQTLLKSEQFDSTFKIFDLLQDHIETDEDKYDVCLDKGTFDAISLCPDIPQSLARSKYFQNVMKLMKDDGRLILTSCNWTANELGAIAKEWLNLIEIIPTPQFSFGGKVGNVVSIVVFKKQKAA